MLMVPQCFPLLSSVDFRHNITVQPTAGVVLNPSSPDSPPGSPSVPRLRAIACK